VGSPDTVREPLFVTFGEELGIATFDELLNYLRYFATPERLQALRDAPPEQRAAAWAAFWKESDPTPSTPEHEGLRDYFERLQTANQRFGEEGTPGWLTDRGKVFATLGEPDQILEQGGPGVTTRGRAQIWVYTQHHVQLVFIDQTGFGRWRLTPSSESDFQQLARRERVH
jgi:GWxTD domain-containing protein